jgi:hypothetical protein
MAQQLCEQLLHLMTTWDNGKGASMPDVQRLLGWVQQKDSQGITMSMMPVQDAASFQRLRDDLLEQKKDGWVVETVELTQEDIPTIPLPSEVLKSCCCCCCWGFGAWPVPAWRRAPAGCEVQFPT